MSAARLGPLISMIAPLAFDDIEVHEPHLEDVSEALLPDDALRDRTTLSWPAIRSGASRIVGGSRIAARGSFSSC